MKQSINSDMLFEIDDEKIKKIAEILGIKVTLEQIENDRKHYQKYKETHGYSILIEDICNKCTIGTMIKILDLYSNAKWNIQTHALINAYRFQAFYTKSNIDSEWNKELVCALWESLIKSIS